MRRQESEGPRSGIAVRSHTERGNEYAGEGNKRSRHSLHNRLGAFII